MEGVAGALKLSSRLLSAPSRLPQGPLLPAADTGHSAIQEVFAEPLLNARHGARLWGHSCEGDKTPASRDSLSAGGDGKAASLQRGKPSPVPRLRLRDSSEEARVVLKTEGEARVRSGKRQGTCFRQREPAQSLGPGSTPRSHLPADWVPLSGLLGGLSEAMASNSTGLGAQGELRAGQGEGEEGEAVNKRALETGW